MAEVTQFYQPGYYDANGNFVPAPIRAQDVIDRNGVSAQTHMINGDLHLTTTQASRIAGAVQSDDLLGSDGKVLISKLPQQALTVSDQSVANIAALLALSSTAAPLNSDVFVSDASADTTVGSGWALYRRVATAGNRLTDWTKLSEGEGLDVAMVDQTARDAAATAQSTANTAKTNATAAQSTADTARTEAGNAQTAADNAQTTANNAVTAAANAMTEARKLDAAVCESTTDMASKGLRPGALVLMKVTNT